MPFPTQNIPQGPSPELLVQLAAQGGLPPVGPPPATPASAGYAAWAADPQNTQKVANSLVKPGQPLLPPNAPQAAQGAATQPTQSPAEVPPVPSAPPVPSGDAAPAPPYTAAPQATSVSAAAPFQSYAEWSAANNDKLAQPTWKHQPGGGFKGVLKDIGGIATAGLLGAAGGLKGDPGAGVRYAADREAYDRSIPDVNQARYKAAVIDPTIAGVQAQNIAAQIGERTSTAAKNTAQAAMIPQKQAAFEAKAGLVRDENGILTFDPNSPYAKNLQAQTLLHQANADKSRILTEIQENKYTPNTIEYDREMKKIQQLDEKLALGFGNLGLRRQNQAALNTGVDPTTGKPFAGAQQIDDGEGNLTTVGARFAKPAMQAQQGAAQYNDVHGALDSMETTAKALAAKTGGTLNTPGVLAALTAAHGEKGYVSSLLSNYLKGANAASLTPEERNYVQSIVAGHENMQGLRKSAGGGSTDTQVDRLEAMIPGAQTPDLNTFLGQTGQIRSTADRLAPGVSSVAGGMKVRGKGGAPTYKAGAASSTPPAGATHIAPGSDGKNHYTNNKGEDLGVAP